MSGHLRKEVICAAEYRLLREIATYAHNFLAQGNRRDRKALERRVEAWLRDWSYAPDSRSVPEPAHAARTEREESKR